MASEAYRVAQGVATMADADLLSAVINGRLPEVKSALDAGVSPDLSYSTGTTLIESACLKAFPFGDHAEANEEIVRLLLRAGTGQIRTLTAVRGFRRYEQRHINGRFQRRPSRPRNCPERGRPMKACLEDGVTRGASGPTPNRLGQNVMRESRASVALTH